MALVPVMAWAQSGTFILEGKVGNMNPPMKMYLAGTMDPAAIIDSSAVRNGSFKFTGKLEGARQIVLVAGSDPSTLIVGRKRTAAGLPAIRNDFKFFYLDEGKTVVASPDSMKTAIVSGASAQVNKDYDELQEARNPVRNRNGSIGQMWMQASEETRKSADFMKAYNAKIAETDAFEKEVLAKYINAHPNSVISVQALSQYTRLEPVVTAEVKALYNTLSAKTRNTAAGKAFAAVIATMEKTGIGSMAPDFVQNDVSGKPVKLSDFKGKYVLIDFWASWCAPCRQENPNVVKAYNQYKDKNFIIIGVSLDNSKEPWLKAIEKDGLTWTHVSDLKAFDNQVVKQYNVTSVPTNFLVGPDGKIIAHNLRGEALVEKLSQVL